MDCAMNNHVASWGQSQKRPPPYAAHQQTDRRVNMRQRQDSGGIKGCNETYQQQQQYFSVTTQKRRRTGATPAVAIFFLVSLFSSITAQKRCASIRIRRQSLRLLLLLLAIIIITLSPVRLRLGKSLVIPSSRRTCAR